MCNCTDSTCEACLLERAANSFVYGRVCSDCKGDAIKVYERGALWQRERDAEKIKVLKQALEFYDFLHNRKDDWDINPEWIKAAETRAREVLKKIGEM